MTTYTLEKYSIEGVSGTDKIMADNILFGDVWICGGQSNMQFSV